MSFCDLVGIGFDRIKLEFGLSNTMAQLIPSAVFSWFFYLSVPSGVLQYRIGKHNVLNLGMASIIALLVIPTDGMFVLVVACAVYLLVLAFVNLKKAG